MPKVKLVFYCNRKGEAPFLKWFDKLHKKVQDKCRVRLERLKELGHELKRPEADYLENQIYELRFKHQSVNYRVLYFFHGNELVVLSHGFTKQRSAVPKKEISAADKRLKKFIKSPSQHTYKE